ncbi:hypothetical protein C8J27_102371 [Rhodobacter aestuarii]|uniref:Uncharacterized protein n=1 Tax=Rhodobacter aestuarii TaxID=453582 RepID=A0A1N7MS61_9RHOB|nr:MULTISPECIES: hypothetical protein [Rhodobacter]PTV96571.1 hypothetical protein C8J27_102371 [Rhodobacter aestuarii]SIS88956.1 hypothetical protein SAMN05421580_106150 [Rhodobacter aestuarii]SOB91472.1 hypothetical protein SAMN05877809_101361 [Rhodobacter sp. JA431]
MTLTEADPKGLIRESYKIEGIGDAECRSIFLDWALSLAKDADPAEAMRAVLAAYGADPAHPMSVVLAEGLTREQAAPSRRGGRAGRMKG